MSKGPEAKVKDKIKKVLNAHCAYYCMPNAGPYGKQGVPDFVGHYRGVFFAIEAKAPGKLYNVSANQQSQIDEIRETGGIAIVADSPDPVYDLIEAIDVAMVEGRLTQAITKEAGYGITDRSGGT